MATVINIWALLGSRVTLLKAAVMMMVIVAAGVASYAIMTAGTSYYFAAATILSQLMLAFTLFLLRMQGFRFVKATRGGGSA